MVIYLAKDKRVITIDHRETAPASFSPTVFRPMARNSISTRPSPAAWPSACRHRTRLA
jgi:gamma-glutamyltranspeptidase